MHLFTPQLAVGLYLYSTHITRNKIIAIVVVAIVVIVALGVWLMRRRRAASDR